MNDYGKLYLIPSPLGEGDPAQVLPAHITDLLGRIGLFIVEEARSARRFLSKAGLRGHIGELEIHELNEHTPLQTVEEYISLLSGGRDAGLISEAGLPAVADPGASLVALAHRRGVQVVPLVGPSSLMLALMASGLNGQSFTFCGYLPAKGEERKNVLRSIEKQSGKLNQTQIFIETPYRNDQMLGDILSVCNGSTRLCVAANITMPDEFIRTMTVEEWKKSGLVIGKRPCVFCLLSSNLQHI